MAGHYHIPTSNPAPTGHWSPDLTTLTAGTLTCAPATQHCAAIHATTKNFGVTLERPFTIPKLGGPPKDSTGFTPSWTWLLPMEPARPVRTAKEIAKIKLLSRHSQPRPTFKPASLTAKIKMAGVATQTDPIPEGQAAVPQVPEPGPPGDAQPQDQETLAGIRSLIKDLSDRVDKVTASRSRSRSASSRRPKRRRSGSSRRASRSTSRSPKTRRRSGTRRRRSSSRSSRRRSSRSSRDRSRSAHSRRRRSSSQSTHTSSRGARKDTVAHDEVTRALDKQYPKMGESAGKRISTRNLTLQPYRHLPPDLKTSAGERKSRRDLTFPEHVCGLLNFALESLSSGTDLHALISHAAQVSQDAATLPWQAVRGWSQAAMAHIQEGRAEWSDSDFIRSERTRLSWIIGRQMEATCKAPCPDFNITKCTERDTHSNEGRTWLHVCAACLYNTGEERSTHGAKGCWSKGGQRQIDDRKNDNRHKGGQYSQKRDKSGNQSKN